MKAKPRKTKPGYTPKMTVFDDTPVPYVPVACANCAARVVIHGVGAKCIEHMSVGSGTSHKPADEDGDPTTGFIRPSSSVARAVAITDLIAFLTRESEYVSFQRVGDPAEEEKYEVVLGGDDSHSEEGDLHEALVAHVNRLAQKSRERLAAAERLLGKRVP